MATTNKSAFEIRLEVLQMARDYLEAQTKLNTKFATEAYEVAVRAGKATTEQWADFTPKMYTAEDIMAKATELYKFITTK